ncbi:MAG: hypothetical protein U1F43_15635 [Myxococcota bacterium]
MRRLFVALLLVGTASAARAQSPPIPLWQNGQTPTTGACPNGQIPRGGPSGQDWSWKERLRNYLKALTPSNVDLGSPPPLPAPFFAYNATTNPTAWMTPYYYTDYACIVDPAWQSVMPNVSSQIDDLILHAGGEEWGGHGLVRFNLSPQHFMLSQLENTQDCRVHTPSYLQDPEITSWANVNYDGNPYRSGSLHAAVLTRGAVWLAWNLLIFDYMSWTDATHQGAFPCSASICPQPAAVVSPTTGLVLPKTGVTYRRYDGAAVTLGALNTNGVQYNEESGGLLAVLAGTYLQVRSILTPAVRLAVEQALYTFADRVGNQPIGVVMANLNHRFLVAIRLCEEAQSDPVKRAALDGLYRQKAAIFYDPSYGFGGIYQPQGTFRDSSGFDVAYNNYNLLHMARLMYLDGPSAPAALRNAAYQSFDLWGHQVFPDPAPSGTEYQSPSAYNSRTGKGAAHDNFGEGTLLQRLLLAGAAQLPWAWGGLAHSYWSLDAGSAWGADVRLFSICSRFILQFQGVFATYFLPVSQFPLIPFATPPAFPGFEGTVPASDVVSRAYQTPNFAFLFGRSGGLVSQWKASAGSPSDLLPYELPQDAYYRSFADAFFYAMPEQASANPDALVALIHAGPVGGMGVMPYGYGGGQISAIWDENGGAFWLARRRNNNYGGGIANGDDDPSEWRSLPIHAVTIGSGQPIPNTPQSWTSSSGIVTPTVSSAHVHDAPSALDAMDALALPTGTCSPAALDPYVPVSGTTALLVRVCGDIPRQEYGSALLSAPIAYTRDFLVGHGYVAVQTLLEPGAQDPIQETYETLPLFYGVDGPGHHQPGDYRITAYGPNGTYNWDFQNGSGGGFEWIDRLEIERYAGRMTIEFERTQRVGLAEKFPGVAQANGRNLLIDVYAGESTFVPTEVRYLIRTY